MWRLSYRYVFRLILITILFHVPVMAEERSTQKSGRLSKSSTTSSAPFVTYLGSLGGKIQLIKASGTLVCMAVGPYLETVDWADPMQPKCLARVRMPGEIRDLKICGFAVYVAVKQQGLRVLDLHEPKNPQLTFSFSFAADRLNEELELELNEPYLKLTGTERGRPTIAVFDISHPLAPVLITDNGSEWNDYQYVTANGKAWYLTFNADLLLTLRSGAARQDQTTASETLLGAVPQDDGMAWVPSSVSDGARLCVEAGGLLWIIDLDAPGKPAVLGRLKLDGPAHLMSLENRWLLMHSEAGMNNYQLVDVRDPRKPRLLDWKVTGSEELYWVGPLLLVGQGKDEQYKLVGYNFADPTTVTQVALPFATWCRYPQEIMTVGSMVLRLDPKNGGNILVADCSDPAHPRMAGKMPRIGETAKLEAAAGSRIYILEDGIVRLMDLANPNQPLSRGEYREPMGDPSAVAVNGPLGCVVDEDGKGLRTIDLTHPDSPRIFGSLVLPDKVKDLRLSGRTAFVTTEDGGVFLVDLNATATPKILGQLKTSGRVQGVELSDNLLAVAVKKAGLQLFNIADPSHPRLCGICAPNSDINTFALGNGRAYVVSTGLSFWNLSAPGKPRMEGQIPYQEDKRFFWSIADLVVHGNYLYFPHGCIDVTNPASPRIAKEYEERQMPKIEEFIEDECLELAMSDQWMIQERHQHTHNFSLSQIRLSLFDTIDPVHPALVSEYHELNEFHHLQLNGDKLYICEHNGGLSIFRWGVPGSLSF